LREEQTESQYLEAEQLQKFWRIFPIQKWRQKDKEFGGKKAK
jgi:hypothetical protein